MAETMPVYQGIEYNESEGVPEFVKRHWRDLKRLGIQRVFSHNTDDEEFKPNTLYIFTLPRNCGWACIRISKTPRIIRVVRPDWGSAADEPYLPSDWAHIFDIILHYGESGGSYRVFIAYSSDLNTFVTCDFTHDYRKWRARAMLQYMQLVKNIVEKRIRIKYPLDPFAGLYDLMLNWPVYHASVIRIDTSVCKRNDVDVATGEGITITFERRGENDRVTIRGVQYRLPTRFKYWFKVTITYDVEGAVESVYGEGRIVIDGRQFDHPNINVDDGNICLGTLTLTKLDLEKELCSQAARIAQMVTDVLATPELTDAYNRELYEYIKTKYEDKLEEAPW
jgi:hypothetical protein